MPILIDRLASEPILMVTISNPLDVKNELPVFADQSKAALDANASPLWVILNTTGVKLAFSNMTEGLAMVTRGKFAVFKHPNAAGFVIAADNDLIRLAASALRQAQYGSVNVTLVTTLDEALANVRSKLAVGVGQ
jgi:hypothetical protein